MRTAVITGGSGGLGLGVVQFFLNQSYQVIAVDLQSEMSPALQALPQQAHLRYASVNALDSASVSQFATGLEQVDVLVNLIGGFEMGPFAEADLSSLDKMLDMNLKASFFMTQALLPALLKSAAGRVINVGARQALSGASQVSLYALSKAALVNLTQSLAQEYQQSSVTFNAVLPSTIDTPANRQGMPDASFEKWVTPEDLAHVIHFLADPASRAINGALIPVYHKA